MNRFLHFLAVIVAVLALPALSQADQIIHVVQKGETASGIAKIYGITVNRLNITDPKGWVYTGQKLVIFDTEKNISSDKPMLWKNPGRAKFVGKDKFAFSKLELSTVESIELEKKIEAKDFEVLPICNGDKFDVMMFGKNVVRKNVIADWKKNHCQAARVYKLSSGTEVWMPFVCRNWSAKKQPVRSEVFLPPPTIPLEPSIGTGLPPAPPKAPEVGSNGNDHEMLDLIMGGGIYKDAHGSDHTGGYVWIKGRFFPWSSELDKDLTLDTGIAAFYAAGGGDDRGYNYDWNELVAGPAFRLTGDGWDGNLDLMLGRLYNDGDVNLYSSSQKDNIFLASMHLNDYRRRQQNELWFPELETNIEFRHVLSSKIDANWNGSALVAEPSDNNAAELTLTPHIYDFNLDGGVRISPLIDFGLGYEQGSETYGRIMPGAALSINETDVLQLRAFGYKDMFTSDNAQISWFAITVDLGGMWKVYRRSQIGSVNRNELNPRLTE